MLRKFLDICYRMFPNEHKIKNHYTFQSLKPIANINAKRCMHNKVTNAIPMGHLLLPHNVGQKLRVDS